MTPGCQWRSVLSAQNTAITATIAAAIHAMATTVPMTSLNRIHAPTARTITAMKRAPRDGLDSVSSMPPRIRVRSVVRANQVREARLGVARVGGAQTGELVRDPLLGLRAAPRRGQRDHVADDCGCCGG